MKIIDGIEALIGNNFTGVVTIIFENECAIKEYKVQALDGKLLFCSEDIKKHFIVTVVHQDVKMITFDRIG